MRREWEGLLSLVCRVGQNRISAPYMTVCMVVSVPKTLYTRRIYLYMYGFGQIYLYALQAYNLNTMHVVNTYLCS